MSLPDGVAEGGQQVMQIRGIREWAALVVLVVGMLLLATAASAKEVQLAGVRIDAPWVTVLDVFGTPAGVVRPGAQPAAAGGGGGAAAPGMGGGMGGGMGMGMGGSMMPGGAMGGGPMMGAGEGSMMGGPGGGMGMMGGGMMGAGGPAAGGGGGGGGSFPMWALPVWVEMEPDEVEWVYQKGEVVIGFVFNSNGYVRVIAVAGETCDYARTALWQPHRYVKLGDDFKRVLYRYGYPDDVETFVGDQGGGGGGGGGAAGPAMGAGMGAPMMGGGGGGGMGTGMTMGMGPGVGVRTEAGAEGAPGGAPAPGGGGMAPGGGGGGGGGGGLAGAISVTFNGTTNEFSRDCILTYSDNNNVAFTLHNMKVTRIHIWKAD
jgi:hypothetical protein